MLVYLEARKIEKIAVLLERVRNIRSHEGRHTAWYDRDEVMIDVLEATGAPLCQHLSSALLQRELLRVIQLGGEVHHLVVNQILDVRVASLFEFRFGEAGCHLLFSG